MDTYKIIRVEEKRALRQEVKTIIKYKVTKSIIRKFLWWTIKLPDITLFSDLSSLDDAQVEIDTLRDLSTNPITETMEYKTEF